MGRKIKIPENIFPTDKELYDLVMSGLITPKKVQETLKEFGIIIQNRDRKLLAESLSSLFLDDSQILAILNSTNIRENRTKLSVIDLNIPGADINDVFEALMEVEYPLADPETRIKIDSKSTPTFSKADDEIIYSQTFKKIDYTKATLIQEESNEFGLKISKGTDSVVQITYTTTNQLSEFFFKNIKDELVAKIKERKPECEPFFYEVLASELPNDKINTFFNELITSKDIGLAFAQVTLTQLTRPEKLEESSEPEEESQGSIDEVDESEGNGDSKDPVIRHLRIEGKDLLNHSDIKAKIDEGFVLRSLEGIFYLDESSSSRKYFLISFGFGTSNKFFSEIKVCEQETAESKKRDKIPLQTSEREMYLKPINQEAFKIFEKYRKKSEVKKNEIQVGNSQEPEPDAKKSL